MRVFIENTEWKVEDKLNVETNKVENEYYYKTEKAIRLKLESRIAQQYSGWILIEKDIRNIMSWLKLFIDVVKEINNGEIPEASQMRSGAFPEKNDLAKGLLIAIVTVYGKLFSQAEGRKVKLEKNIYADSEAKLNIHESILELRNKYAAHGGAHEYEYVNIAVLLDSNRERNTLPAITKELSQPESFNYRDIPLFNEMLVTLKEYANNKIVIIGDKVMDGILSKDLDFWYYMAELET